MRRATSASRSPSPSPIHHTRRAAVTGVSRPPITPASLGAKAIATPSRARSMTRTTLSVSASARGVRSLKRASTASSSPGKGTSWKPTSSFSRLRLQGRRPRLPHAGRQAASIGSAFGRRVPSSISRSRLIGEPMSCSVGSCCRATSWPSSAAGSCHRRRPA